MQDKQRDGGRGGGDGEMGGKHDWLKLQFASEVDLQMPPIKGQISKRGWDKYDGLKL